MRELHDGIELLDSETAAGPFVWQNIDKWITRAENIIRSLEAVSRGPPKSKVAGQAPEGNTYVIGADFDLFKEALSKYRRWLEDMYDGTEGIKERLVFAHNDVCRIWTAA